ncbi:MAG TPA: hypothetical protein VHD87_16415 [Acidimicrobiales bacterium]|nr:hypothetical protein [Acidimicrobiales bacterium]
MKPLDVMVLESSPHVGDDAVHRLEQAGHRVHRCHQADAAAFPCNALRPGETCPLANGVDVALVVNAGAEPTPTTFEEGVGCALRAQVPLVEDSPIVPSALAPWLTALVEDDDIEDAVRRGAERGWAPLRDAARVAIAPLLAAAGIEDHDVHIHFERVGRDITVTLAGAIPAGLASGLAVRAADAVRASGRQYGRLDVRVVPTTPRHWGCVAGL